MWEVEIEQAINSASCGVIVLTPQSIRSPWIWYETGRLVGNNTTIIPFIMSVNDGKTTEFINQLPQFISRIQIISDINRLVNVISNYIFRFSDIFPKEKDEINKKIKNKLKKVKLTFLLEDINEELHYCLRFGYQIVRFGRWDVINNEPFNLDLDETTRIHKIKHIDKSSFDIKSNEIKIEFILPVHNIWGLTFKFFVDVDNLKQINNVMRILEENKFIDITQSDSGEKQRIYFLIPKEYCKVVEEPDRILNNFIYPV